MIGTLSTGYTSSATTEQQTVQRHRLYKPDGTQRPIIWCHQLGNTATDIFHTDRLSLIATIVDQLGAPLISFDAAGNSWGNDDGQSRLTDAISYLRSKYGASPSLKPIILGVSMGGILALNWARANPTLVAAIGLFYPVVDLQWIHDNVFTASTEAAYGGSTASFNAAVASHNPAQNAASYTGVPIKMWYSTTDTVVNTSTQTTFASNVGGSAFISRSLGPVTHADMTQVPASEVISFITAQS